MFVKTNIVVFDYSNDPSYSIVTLGFFLLMRPYLYGEHVYTDLFIGSEDDCIKFCNDHKFKIA